MKRYPILFKRVLPQEQTVYIETEHEFDDIVDWFENAGLKPLPPHRHSRSGDGVPASVEMMKQKLTEEGWENRTGYSFNYETRPEMERSWMYEGELEEVPTPEGFVDEFDEPIREHLKDRPKRLRKEFFKEQRKSLKQMNERTEEMKRVFRIDMENLKEGLSTNDYSMLDKTEKKLVDDFYKISPYPNPLNLQNY
jgi:hypothetical protein